MKRILRKNKDMGCKKTKGRGSFFSLSVGSIVACIKLPFQAKRLSDKEGN